LIYTSKFHDDSHGQQPAISFTHTEQRNEVEYFLPIISCVFAATVIVLTPSALRSYVTISNRLMSWNRAHMPKKPKTTREARSSTVEIPSTPVSPVASRDVTMDTVADAGNIEFGGGKWKDVGEEARTVRRSARVQLRFPVPSTCVISIAESRDYLCRATAFLRDEIQDGCSDTRAIGCYGPAQMHIHTISMCPSTPATPQRYLCYTHHPEHTLLYLCPQPLSPPHWQADGRHQAQRN